MGDWGGGEVPCDLNVVEDAIGSEMHNRPTCFGTALVCSLKAACQEVWRGLVCSLHTPHLTCQPWFDADPHTWFIQHGEMGIDMPWLSKTYH